MSKLQRVLAYRQPMAIEEMDFRAFGFDARNLDAPEAGWRLLQAHGRQTAADAGDAKSSWAQLLRGSLAWDARVSSTHSWTAAGEDWSIGQPMAESRPAEPVVQVQAAPVLTAENGFQVVVSALPVGRVGVLAGQADRVVQAGDTILVLIASDAFTHVSADARVQLRITLADGKPVPHWIRFNGITGQLLVQPPEDFAQVLALQLMAIDQDGETARTVFQLDVQPKTPSPEGRLSFSEKLKQSARVSLSASASNMEHLLRYGPA